MHARYNLDMRDLVVMGLGELGQFFAGGALKAGIRVTPVTRACAPSSILAGFATHQPILVATGEADLPTALAALPVAHRSQLILLQNELFPSQWQDLTERPTIMIPWLLKKRGEPLLVARATPVYGPQSALVIELHQALGVDAVQLANEAELAQAIVDKYAFILTVNALGLLRDETLGEWLVRDPSRIDALAREGAALGQRLVGRAVDPEHTELEVRRGLAGMGGMRARGRSARSRVARALGHAQELGVRAPQLLEASRATA
jgi:hypothetical protein